jgi:hypothetical protein
MIARVRRRRDVGALLRELYQPGDASRRGLPRLPARQLAGPGPAGPDAAGGLRQLAEWLTEPLARAQPGAPRRDVWHCTVQAHPDDPALTDQQWAHVATEIMHGTGLAPRGDTLAVRWAAARHGDDHIHIIATLARQDGTMPPAGGNVRGARNACHAAEDQYGLHSTRLSGAAGPAAACAVTEP